jgi:uroporphyrinogen decarboxylase
MSDLLAARDSNSLEARLLAMERRLARLEQRPVRMNALDEISDDLGDQRSTLVSPDLYRSLIKPRHAALFAAIKKIRPDVRIVFHCDGAIRELIPDLIEIGVDALNPVQYGLPGMDAAGLKRDFGKDLTFWGGALDTQTVLPKGTPAEIRDEVRRNIEILAPGGGFVACQTHIIQHDVPTENLVAYLEAVQEYR